MLKPTQFYFGVLVLGICGLGTAAQAAVITGVSVSSVSSQLFVGTFTRQGSHTVDGSGGVPVNSDTGMHVSDPPDGTMWLTTGTGLAGGGADPHITANDGELGDIVYDLGDVYNVSGFRLWNYNETVGFNARSAKNVSIEVSSTSSLSGLTPSGTYTTLADPTVFTQAPGAAGYAGELYNTSFTGRYVRIDIASSYGGDNGFVGLSEIRFDGALVPEPASLAVSLGLFPLLLRRRRLSAE